MLTLIYLLPTRLGNRNAHRWVQVALLLAVCMMVMSGCDPFEKDWPLP